VHPHFRLSWVTDPEEKKTITAWVLEEAKKLAGLTDSQESGNVDSQRPHREIEISDDEEDENEPGPSYGPKRMKVTQTSSLFMRFAREKQRPSASVLDMEVNAFLNHPVSPADLNEKIDPKTLGSLLDLYLKTNTPLPSSAPVERLFSLAGRIFVPLRANLGDDTFARLLFLRANMHLYDIDTGKPTSLALQMEFPLADSGTSG
jgi:hypothetical protein